MTQPGASRINELVRRRNAATGGELRGHPPKTGRRLQGLPAYGPVATGFPEEWARLGREGLVVEFTATDGTKWVGNFRPGPGGLDDVRWHPNRRQALVAAAGAFWSVDPVSRVGEQVASAVLSIYELESGDLLLDEQGLAFVRLGRWGVVWHTRRISWDGFQTVGLEAERRVDDGLLAPAALGDLPRPVRQQRPIQAVQPGGTGF